MELSADREGLVLAGLEVDQGALRTVLAREPGHIAVRRPGQGADRVEAAADESSRRLEVALRVLGWCVQGPLPRADVGPLGGVGVVLEAHPVCDEPGVALGDRLGRTRDVEPVGESLGDGVGGVGEVVAVQGRDPSTQRQGEHHRRQVGPADQPGRLGCGDGVPVDLVEEVDRGLATPRRDDRADGGVDQHRGELGGAGGLGGRHVAGAVHAIADHDVVPASAQPVDAEVDPPGGGAGDPAGRRGDADPVAGSQGRGEADHRRSSSPTAAIPASTSAKEVDSGESPIRRPPGSR